MTNANHMTLTSNEEISAYLHHTRMEIMQVLANGPATITQIATQMGVHPANLTRHVRILVKTGLVTLDHTRDTGRNLEKYYRPVAESFDIAPNAQDLNSPDKIALSFARSDLSAAIAQLPEKTDQSVLTLLASARINPEDLAAFCERLQSLVAEFEAADTPDGAQYHINCNIYPGVWAHKNGRILLKRSENTP
jgi:DNA-binding transcriptional ArsR family regulator